MKVRVKADKRLGLKAGVYESKPYFLDPATKLTLFDKKGEEICTVYRNSKLRFVREKKI